MGTRSPFAKVFYPTSTTRWTPWASQSVETLWTASCQEATSTPRAFRVPQDSSLLEQDVGWLPGAEACGSRERFSQKVFQSVIDIFSDQSSPGEQDGMRG